MHLRSTANRRRSVPDNKKEGIRQNHALRELVDDLLNHVRNLFWHVEKMSVEDLEDARRRFNSIAELIWAAILDEKNRPHADSEQG